MSRYAQIAWPGAMRRQHDTGRFVDEGAPLSGSGRNDEPMQLDFRERGFITRVESFFISTVTPTGWPYIQHRGGPKGFLHVLDAQTIGFADFQGNQQYVTAGNLHKTNRVALFLIDYPLRERLKLFGTAEMIAPADDPALTEHLLTIGNRRIRSRVDRLIRINIEAYDWNCTSHIKPLYDKARLDEAVQLARQAQQHEVDQLTCNVETLQNENADLIQELRELRRLTSTSERP